MMLFDRPLEYMKVKIKKQTRKKHFLTIALSVVFLGNTIIVSQKKIVFYERARDAAIILIMASLFVYSLFYIFKERGNFWEYLAIANIALIITVIHLLRLNFNGLLC